MYPLIKTRLFFGLSTRFIVIVSPIPLPLPLAQGNPDLFERLLGL
jgi:hypothetical protein